MLVIARKRHEAVTIDGNIRVEVLRLAGGVARLRFLAPRRIAIQRGVARPGEPAAVEAVQGGIDASGTGVVDLTLGGQQIVTISDDIHLGVVDISAARAILFVDAPEGTAVNLEATSRSRSNRGRCEAADDPTQALLPFAAPSENGSDENRAREPRKSAADTLPLPIARTIPFPLGGHRGDCDD
jgi:sRNA-binding carbon storage regulator CsrA